MSIENYDVVVGLEVHVQLRTKSKMFCSCANLYGSEPNTTICPICTGYPGVMPLPNYEAIRKTIVAGMMCECEIPELSKFDRKSYFYPDMPKNYQISQYDLPLCKRGLIHIFGKGFSGELLHDKNIGITRIHLEEDVAKSTHYTLFSGIDYNRAGVPLMEIVSDPDMSSADEAYAYLSNLKLIMQYGEISDCDMEKGQMRCDVNISLKPKGRKEFGTKIELKNLNSFRSVHRAINHEITRQADILDAGGVIRQETRAWNDDKGATYLMRVKESTQDYRYFPEPDLAKICFTKEELEKIRLTIPELPSQMVQRFVRDYELPYYDAQVLTADKELAKYFDDGAKVTKSRKLLANWIISELLREIAKSQIAVKEMKVSSRDMAKLVDMINSNVISGKIGKIVFEEMLATGQDPEFIVKEKGLVQLTDEYAIIKVVNNVIASNPSQVAQYKAGKCAVLQYFVGEVMRISKGKANPKSVIKLLKEQLDV